MSGNRALGEARQVVVPRNIYLRLVMETGVVGQYRWLESVESDFRKILKGCPGVLIGKCLVISCFDSGPLLGTEEELRKGWEQHGDLLIVPMVDAVSDLPYDNYDEWYIFPTYEIPQISEVFVNAPMTLKNPELLMMEYAASVSQPDIVGARSYFQTVEEQQSLFWDEIIRVAPESSIGSGDQLIFLCRKPEIFEAVLAAIK